MYSDDFMLLQTSLVFVSGWFFMLRLSPNFFTYGDGVLFVVLSVSIEALYIEDCFVYT